MRSVKPKSKPKKTISIRISSDMDDFLNKMAAEQYRSRSAMLEILLRDAQESYEKHWIKNSKD